MIGSMVSCYFLSLLQKVTKKSRTNNASPHKANPPPAIGPGHRAAYTNRCGVCKLFCLRSSHYSQSYPWWQQSAKRVRLGCSNKAGSLPCAVAGGLRAWPFSNRRNRLCCCCPFLLLPVMAQAGSKLRFALFWASKRKVRPGRLSKRKRHFLPPEFSSSKTILHSERPPNPVIPKVSLCGSCHSLLYTKALYL